MQLTLVGIDHRTAPMAIREQLHLSADASRRLLTAVRETFPGCEAFVLSTCNRTELLFAEPDGGLAHRAWHLLVREAIGATRDHEAPEPCADPATGRYRHEGLDAARHLFRVAGGLDSAVLGDVDVLGQIRDAVELARSEATLGKHLHALLRRALEVGKRIRRETDIAVGGAGIGSAVASILERRLAADARIVLVGAGMAARAVAAQLDKRGHGRVTVVNRTRARAEDLAATVAARVDDLAALPSLLTRADAVVTLVAGGSLVLDRETLDRAVAGRGGARLLAVDGCLPHAVEDHPGVDLVTLDTIAEHQEDVRRAREEAVPDAEVLVEEAVGDWRAWLDRSALDDVVAHLFRSADEFAATAGRVLDESEARALRRDVRRVVHERATALRSAAVQR